jgi:hypothetical protein
MRTAFWSVAIAIAVGASFEPGIVLPSDHEGALAPAATIPEGPPQPPVWSCDGSNWIVYDRECGRRRLHKHHRHPVIAADGKDSTEARREPASASENSPAPVKSVQISLSRESAPKRETKADSPGNWRQHRRSSQLRTARLGEPPRIPPALYGYYAHAAMQARGVGRRGEGAPAAPTPIVRRPQLRANPF